jgi:hypothetical protein
MTHYDYPYTRLGTSDAMKLARDRSDHSRLRQVRLSTRERADDESDLPILHDSTGCGRHSSWMRGGGTVAV